MPGSVSGESSSWLAEGALTGTEIPVSLPRLVRTPVPVEQGPTFMISLNLSDLLRVLVSKYGHIRVRASAYEFGGTQFSP